MTNIKLDFFLENPELKRQHELAIPTKEMYRFFPPQEEILLKNDNPKKNYRFIFNGHPKTDYEKRKLSEYAEYESKHGRLMYPPGWLESDTMRLLQASEYDLKKTYNTIKENIEFRNNMPKSLNEKNIKLLNSGLTYVYGRDHHFRPLIVVSIKTCTNLLKHANYTLEDLKRTISYLLEYVVNYILIPGQIENWVTIIDFKGVGISDISEFKEILGTLSKFRGRVFRNYMVNISGFLKFSVKAAVNLFGSSSANKLKILGEDELHKLQEIISKDNIQRKYGGTAEDINPGTKNLFPPIMPSTNYAVNGEKLNIISEEAYKEMCINSNPYKPYVISPIYEEMWKEQKEEESLKKKESIKIMERINSIKPKSIKTKKTIKKSVVKPEINNNNDSLMMKKKFIQNFVDEFESYNFSRDLYEEQNYFVNSPVNIQEINNFFEKIQKKKNSLF